MSQVSSGEQANPLQEFTVVDCDVHVAGVSNPVIGRKVAERMEEPYRTYMHPEASRARPLYPNHGYAISIPDKTSNINQSLEDPDEHIQKPLCDELGVDHPLLNLMSKLDHVAETERAIQEMRAINDVLVEHFLDGHDNFYGLASLTTKEPDKAAEEIDRMAAEKNVVGAFLHLGGQDKPLGDVRHDPIFEALQENEFPFTLHPTGSSMMWEAGPIFKDLERYIAVHAVNHPWEGMLQLTSLVVEGVPVKFPDLDFVFLESGIGWAPYMMYRLNREHAQRRIEAPLLEKQPEEYIRDNFYFANQPIGEPMNPQHMRHTVDMVGSDSLVFSTDYPHYDFDNPESILQVIGHLDRDERADIMYGNASRIYGLGLD